MFQRLRACLESAVPEIEIVMTFLYSQYDYEMKAIDCMPVIVSTACLLDDHRYAKQIHNFSR